MLGAYVAWCWGVQEACREEIAERKTCTALALALPSLSFPAAKLS